MSVKVCCDFCEKPLKIVMEDVDGVLTECYELNYTTELNTRKIYPHLCSDCRDKLDSVLVVARDEWLKQIDISVKNAKINEARRGLLGTKG